MLACHRGRLEPSTEGAEKKDSQCLGHGPARQQHHSTDSDSTPLGLGVGRAHSKWIRKLAMGGNGIRSDATGSSSTSKVGHGPTPAISDEDPRITGLLGFGLHLGQCCRHGDPDF